MKEKVQKIKFNGSDFILTCPEDDDSPIATIETYQKGECSYGHFYRESGIIMRFQQQIGTVKDIEFGEMIEIEIDPAEAFEGMMGSTWLI